MENITHSLIGATFAEIALPGNATPKQRTLFFVTGIVAANLPDADLLYTRITPAPLGYLLHHRGYTHTLGGIAILAVLAALVSLLPRVRESVKPYARRFAVLVVAALASHLVADSWNSYGVHPFWPFSNHWYYGDAVYIAEPWLWMLFGVSVAMNTRNARGRALIAGLLIVIPVAAALVGLVAMPALIPIAIVAVILVRMMRDQPPPSRAWLSVMTVVLFVGASFVLRRAVRQVVVAADAHNHRHVVDVVLDPRPANPLCWTALLLETDNDTLFIRHGAFDVSPSLSRFDPCGENGSGVTTGEAQSLPDLRLAMQTDCYVRAWLEFARAPVFEDGVLADVRFGAAGRGNFTAMEVAPTGSPRNCPTHLTHWDLPRADVLARGASSSPHPR